MVCRSAYGPPLSPQGRHMVCRSAYGLPTSIRSADQQMVCRPAYGPPTSMWSADLPSACAQVADSAAFPSQARASRFSTWTTTCACTAPSTASTSCSSEPAAGRSEEAARQPAHSWQMSWWRVFTNEADSMLRLAGVIIHVEVRLRIPTSWVRGFLVSCMCSDPMCQYSFGAEVFSEKVLRARLATNLTLLVFTPLVKLQPTESNPSFEPTSTCDSRGPPRRRRPRRRHK